MRGKGHGDRSQTRLQERFGFAGAQQPAAVKGMTRVSTEFPRGEPHAAAVQWLAWKFCSRSGKRDPAGQQAKPSQGTNCK